MGSGKKNSPMRKRVAIALPKQEPSSQKSGIQNGGARDCLEQNKDHFGDFDQADRCFLGCGFAKHLIFTFRNIWHRA